MLGDEVSASMGLVGISLSGNSAFMASPLASQLSKLPNDLVSRTPYTERSLVDYGAKNLKASGSLHYRITDKLELLYHLNYGAGTSVYTGAQRYSLKDFNIQQHKIELKGDNFFLRGYTTIEDSVDSYIADLTGVLVNASWKGNSQWFSEYAQGYLTYFLMNPSADFNDPGTKEIAHGFGRTAADDGRLTEGSAGFKSGVKKARSNVIPNGSLFADKTKLYHAEGQYNFKNEIKFMDLMVGASYRLYDLNSNGTIFADTA